MEQKSISEREILSLSVPPAGTCSNNDLSDFCRRFLSLVTRDPTMLEKNIKTGQ